MPATVTRPSSEINQRPMRGRWTNVAIAGGASGPRLNDSTLGLG